MYTRILVPLDGSEFAAQALPYARLIGQAMGAEVELFRAVPPLIDFLRKSPPTVPGDVEDSSPVAPSTLMASPWEERYAQARQRVKDEMEAMAESLRGMGLAARVELGEGDPATATASEADRMPGTLIIMTTHGRSGILRAWGGSVMDKTVHLTSTPALVVRCREDEQVPEDIQIRRIILPLDGSTLAEEAMPHAMALAKKLDAPVEVLQAFSKTRIAVGPSGAEGVVGAENATGYLDSIVERMWLGGLTKVEGTPVQGDAANSIVEAAESAPDSIVVMSTHGRSGLGRLLKGSVADKVMRRGGRPVLMVRPTQ